MFTLIILSIVIGAILALISYVVDDQPGMVGAYSPFSKPFAAFLIPVVTIILIVVSIQIIIINVSHPSNIATPAKYTNQNYYIDSNANLYVDQNGNIQLVTKPKEQLIQYNKLAKSPSVEFKTTKTLTANMSNWIPFYFESKTKTSISRIILPKSVLNQKLTKVDVVNPIQDSTDLTLTQ